MLLLPCFYLESDPASVLGLAAAEGDVEAGAPMSSARLNADGSVDRRMPRRRRSKMTGTSHPSTNPNQPTA
jgi:hypothetical protein